MTGSRALRSGVVVGVETSGKRGGVALVSSQGTQELVVPMGRDGGEVLPLAVEALLRLAHADRTEIKLVAVDVGPGSFTGLRIGVAFAKGMAQALGIPVVGVRQTEAIARPMAWWPGKVVVWIHDRREFVYMAAASRGRVGAETVLPWRDALARVAEGPGTLLIGSGVEEFRAEIEASDVPVACASAALAYPRPGEIALLGQARFTEEGAGDPRQLEPHYVHKEV